MKSSNLIIVTVLVMSLFVPAVATQDGLAFPEEQTYAGGLLHLADDHDQQCLVHQLPDGCAVCASCSLLDSPSISTRIEGSFAVIAYVNDLASQLAPEGRFRPPTTLSA